MQGPGPAPRLGPLCQERTTRPVHQPGRSCHSWAWPGARPHLKCQHLDFAPADPLAQLFQAAGGQGLKLSDLSPAHCARGPARGAGREELQANKVEKLPLESPDSVGWE